MADNDADFINANLQFLKKKTGRLHEIVDEFVNEVSSACQSWLEKGESKQTSFAEINTRLCYCITYVNQKADQIAKETTGDKALALTLKDTSTETKPLSSSTSQMSASTSRSPPVVQGQEPDCPRELLARLQTVELALSSVHSVTEKISENQTNMETQVQEIKQKQSEIEEVTTNHLANTEKQLKKANKRSEGMKQQEKKVASLEKDMDVLKKQDKRVSSLETQIQDVKKQDKRLDHVEKEMKTMSSNQPELETKTFVKIASVEKQIETNTDLTYHLKAGIESVSNKTEANESSIQELTSRLQLADTTVQDLSAKVDQNKSSIDEVNLKTRNLNKKINKYQKNTGEKLQEVEQGYHMVCCMVADRLLPLERLRRILNQKVKDREDNVKKLGDVCTTVASLQNKVSDLENKQPMRTGFSATLDKVFFSLLLENGTVRGFDINKYNLGNHFNPSTGIFTAPVAGFYIASVEVSRRSPIRYALEHEKANPEPEDPSVSTLFEIDTDAEQSSKSFSIVEMSPMDQLYVTKTMKRIGFTGTITFSCFLVW